MPLSAALAMAAMAFSIALVVAIAMLLPFMRRREAQKTLRTAIEHGQVLDAAVLDRLLQVDRPRRGSARRDLLISGVITLFAGGGLAMLGWLISLGKDARAFHALAGTAALVAMIGCGLLAAGWVAGKTDTADRHDAGA